MTFDTKNILTGLYEGVSNADYHSAPGVSKSGLDAVNVSPAHYQSYLHEKRPQTPAMAFGSAVHTAVLEPELFGEAYTTIPPDAPRKPTTAQLNAKKPSDDTVAAIAWWQEFEQSTSGRTIIGAEDMEKIIKLRDAVYAHPWASTMLTKPGPCEASCWAEDDETGLTLKCRPDKICVDSGVVLDLKTCASAAPGEFSRSMHNYRYHVQAAYYQDVLDMAGVGCDAFVFIAVEKEPPYGVAVYHLPSQAVGLGRRAYRDNLRTLQKAIDTGNWPAYSDRVVELDLPKWAYYQEDH